MNKNKLQIILMIIGVFVIMSGCGTVQRVTSTDSEIVEKQTQAYCFKDDLGREVTIASHDRTAALIGSFAEVWTLAGGKVSAAVADAWDSFELDLDSDTVNLGSLQNPNAELIIAAQPDFVIASANLEADVSLEPLLTQSGITVAYFDVNEFEDYLHMLDICTDITGRKDLYQQNGVAVAEQIQAILKRVEGYKEEPPKILSLRASGSSVKVKGSTDTVGGEILKDLGCINIADSDESMLDTLSLENIIAANPDYIFLTCQGNDMEKVMQNVDETLTTNPAWASLTAVKEGKYYILDKKLYNQKPNARWGEAYEKLADILYPISS